MKKIVAFIDYFHGESGFVTPVYMNDDINYYIEKWIDQKVDKYILDDRFREQLKNFTNGKSNLINISFIPVLVDLLIPETNELLFAFKFNRDFIIVGDRKSVAENILYGIGTIDNKLSIFNEIKNFIEKSNIKNVNEYLTELLYIYDNKNYFNDIIKDKAINQNYLKHSHKLNQTIGEFRRISKKIDERPIKYNNFRAFISKESRKNHIFFHNKYMKNLNENTKRGRLTMKKQKRIIPRKTSSDLVNFQRSEMDFAHYNKIISKRKSVEKFNRISDGKESIKFVKIIENRNNVVLVEKENIAFRLESKTNIKPNKKVTKRTSNNYNYSIEIERINNFKKLLTPHRYEWTN